VNNPHPRRVKAADLVGDHHPCTEMIKIPGRLGKVPIETMILAGMRSTDTRQTKLYFDEALPSEPPFHITFIRALYLKIIGRERHLKASSAIRLVPTHYPKTAMMKQSRYMIFNMHECPVRI
jgi:hypothetical protein